VQDASPAKATMVATSPAMIPEGSPVSCPAPMVEGTPAPTTSTTATTLNPDLDNDHGEWNNDDSLEDFAKHLSQCSPDDYITILNKWHEQVMSMVLTCNPTCDNSSNNDDTARQPEVGPLAHPATAQHSAQHSTASWISKWQLIVWIVHTSYTSL